jgi:hypothetical protein
VNVVQIGQVDERDSGWENDRPRFRVYLHGSGPTTTHGWTDTYDVTGADVLQVIDWAQRQAKEQLYPGFGRGLVWLVGVDGNGDPIDAVEEDRQSRMLARRTAPVSVPVADRMPPGPIDPYHDGTKPGRH